MPRPTCSVTNAKLDPFLTQVFQQFRRKMQSCGRCSGRTRRFRVNRLISFRIVQFFLDIRRQRHGAKLIQNSQKDSVIMKTDQPIAVWLYRLHRSSQQSVPQKSIQHPHVFFVLDESDTPRDRPPCRSTTKLLSALSLPTACPIKRAGITRELLNTMQSPG